MSGSPPEDRFRVQVHPGAGVVDRRGDTLLVVPQLPTSSPERVRELLELCSRPVPAGDARVPALRALLDLRPPADTLGFALLVRTGRTLQVLVHGPVQLLVDGRARRRPGEGIAEHAVADGEWHVLTVVADGGAALPGVADVLPLDLELGAVPGGGVTLHRLPAALAQQFPAAEPTAAGTPPWAPSSATALRPAVPFRTVPLGECAARVTGAGPGPERRPPLPVAGARGGRPLGAGTTGPEVLVEGVHCPSGHFTDPDLPTCLTCGAPLPPAGQRLRLPRPPLGVLVSDGGTVYTVTGDFVIGREPTQAPDVLAGRARPLLLRDAALSTSRVHARLTVTGWKVLLSDDRSANGTFVSRHGAAGPWLPATAHAPVPLAHGDRVRLGRRQLLFDTWRETVVPQVFQ
jgi:FHA domain